MATERESFIKQQLEAGERRDAVRRELISNGFSTEGFESEYQSLAMLLKIKDPLPVITTLPTQLATKVNHIETMPSFFDMLRYGCLVARFNSLSLIVLGLVASLGFLIVFTSSLLLSLRVPPEVQSVLVGGVQCVGGLLVLLSVITLIYMMVWSKQVNSFLVGYVWASNHVSTMLWLGFILISMFLVGSAAMVLPGILFLFYSIFALMVMVREDLHGFQAVARSVDLVVGQFWGIVGRVSGILLVGSILLAALVVSIVLVFTKFADVPFTSYIVLVGGVVLLAFILSIVLGGIAHLFEARSHQKPLFELNGYSGVVFAGRICVTVLSVSIVGYLLYTHADWRTFLLRTEVRGFIEAATSYLSLLPFLS